MLWCEALFRFPWFSILGIPSGDFGAKKIGYFFFKQSFFFKLSNDILCLPWINKLFSQSLNSEYLFEIWISDRISMLCSKLNQLFPEKKFRFLRNHWAILKMLMFERMMLWNHYFHENQHIKNLQVRSLKSSFARNFNLCFRFGEFGVEKWKLTRGKCLRLLDVVVVMVRSTFPLSLILGSGEYLYMILGLETIGDFFFKKIKTFSNWAMIFFVFLEWKSYVLKV